MIDLSKKTRNDWRKILGSKTAEDIFSFMREYRNRPKIPEGENTQPHQIQFAAGVQRGWDQCLDVLENIARDDRPISMEDGTPTIKDTRNLGRE